MSKLKEFTQEFEDEAVHLARTSGRTRRETAENLGVELSPLTRWIARRRDREIDFPDEGRTEDAAAGLSGYAGRTRSSGRFCYASPKANTGDGGNHALTIWSVHLLGADQSSAFNTSMPSQA